MRAKLLIAQTITNPAILSVAEKKAIVHQYLSGLMTQEEYKRRIEVFAPVGTEIEHPEAWRLVEAGIAEPCDQECMAAVDSKRLRRMAAIVDRAQRLDVAQASGTPIDASDEAVARFRAAREARRENLLDEAPKLVTPA